MFRTFLGRLIGDQLTTSINSMVIHPKSILYANYTHDLATT